MCLQLQIPKQSFQVKHFSYILLEQLYDVLHQVPFLEEFASAFLLSHGDVF
jgi:hypothetical protein